MRTLFPMSVPAMRKSDTSSSHLLFGSLVSGANLSGTGVFPELRSGDKVFQMGPGNTGYSTSLLALGMPEFNRLCARGDDPFGVVIFPYVDGTEEDWMTPYVEAANDPRVSLIALGSGRDEFSRMSFLLQVTKSGEFNKLKRYWMYGAYNPAEVSVLRSLFTHYVISKFDAYVCSSCFIYSVFGSLFSSEDGCAHTIPGVDHTSELLGMYEWVNYDMSPFQMRIMKTNMEMVRSFAIGVVTAERYVARAREVLL